MPWSARKAPGRVATCKTPSAQRHYLAGHQRRRLTGVAIVSEQAGWKTARWIVPNSVTERQTPSVVICGHSRDSGAGLVADQAADRKTAKYADLRAQYVFQPVSVENLGPFSSSTITKQHVDILTRCSK